MFPAVARQHAAPGHQLRVPLRIQRDLSRIAETLASGKAKPWMNSIVYYAGKAFLTVSIAPGGIGAYPRLVITTDLGEARLTSRSPV